MIAEHVSIFKPWLIRKKVIDKALKWKGKMFVFRLLKFISLRKSRLIQKFFLLDKLSRIMSLISGLTDSGTQVHIQEFFRGGLNPKFGPKIAISSEQFYEFRGRGFNPSLPSDTCCRRKRQKVFLNLLFTVFLDEIKEISAS